MAPGDVKNSWGLDQIGEIEEEATDPDSTREEGLRSRHICRSWN